MLICITHGNIGGATKFRKVYGFFEPIVFSFLKELIIITIKNLKKIPK